MKRDTVWRLVLAGCTLFWGVLGLLLWGVL